MIRYSVKTCASGAWGVCVSGICAQLHSEPASPFSRSPSFLQPALLRVGSPCPGRAHCHREPQHQPVSHPRTPALHPTKDLGLWETGPGSRRGEWCLPPSLFKESLLAECFPSYPSGSLSPTLSCIPAPVLSLSFFPGSLSPTQLPLQPLLSLTLATSSEIPSQSLSLSHHSLSWQVHVRNRPCVCPHGGGGAEETPGPGGLELWGRGLLPWYVKRRGPFQEFLLPHHPLSLGWPGGVILLCFFSNWAGAKPERSCPVPCILVFAKQSMGLVPAVVVGVWGWRVDPGSAQGEEQG